MTIGGTPTTVGDVAHRLPWLLDAIRSCLPASVDSYEVPDQDHAALMGEIEHAVRNLRDEYDAEQGPLAVWPARHEEDMFERLDVHVVDFDAEDGWWVADGDEWDVLELDEQEFYESSFGRAARAYRREAGWDFAPGAAGIWVVAYAPSWWCGGSDGDGHARGNLVSFAILHDRDEDGDVESLAHLWTARAVRRRGAARQVLTAARERHQVHVVEGPATDDGIAFLRSAAPDLMESAA